MYTMNGPHATDDQHVPALAELAAQLDGWASVAEKARARLVLNRCAAEVIEQRESVGDPCICALDVQDGLEDRWSAGLVTVENTRRVVVLNLIRECAGNVWREVLAAQERAAWDIRHAECADPMPWDEQDMGRAA